ncbi:LIM/homeobox protein Lhx9-like [Diprion similis]|uniref:LIM/homeobox protein Lhx9-like n=1 Tax=Diprion similis TaxID=362088 RepID=UPI001EF79691|nr:LIM/homeobox protein Lhx9-like [Diprion similis]XP_046735900.1 LIM/homeobox protein Lhx9-like [Diprion similis]XP_046735901.1 LIM/homeobox protein Lhx9-like [Diprion similis]XP_046735903.1 LIM/homeobox protein Lhx9-like [Diprion similis]
MNPHHPGHPGHQGHPGHPSHPAAYPHHQSLSSSPHHPGPGNAHHGYTPGGGGGGGGGPTTTPDLPSPHSPSHGAPTDPGVPYTTLTGSQGMPSNGHHHGAGGGMIGEHPHHPGHPHPHHPGHPAYAPVNHNNNCTLKQEEGPGGPTSIQQCAGCGGRIVERWLLLALDRYWHNGCLKCTCCGAALAEIGRSCFTKGNMILCKNDYTRLFGSTGACAGCSQTIPASDYVMRAGGAVFHQKCFTCSKCGTQLLSGDRYGLGLSGAPVCETDWHKMVKSAGVGASGNGGAPVRKGKVGRPRRSRD